MKKLLFKYYIPLFFIFSFAVLAFQYNREKQYKADMLNTLLGDTNDMIYNYFESKNGSLAHIDSLIAIFPHSDIRVTIIDLKGSVVYDNAIQDVMHMENHLSRKEVKLALQNGNGSDIRTSHTNQRRYYYHATKFGNCYVRSSLPYDVNISSLLRPDNLFLYFWLALTFIIAAVLFYISNKFSIKLNREQIEHDAMVRRRLTHQVAHELKTPLSSIIGYMETLHDNPDIAPERQRFFIERSHAQAERLNSLLQDILMLNQINEAPQSVQMEPVHLNKVVQTVLDDVELKLQEKNIEVYTSFGGDIWLKANTILLYSIFRNLIDNAIAYAGENIKINLTLTGEDAKCYHFAFSDNGIGVAPEHLPFLFDRFYRVDKGRSRKTGGTGLGLSIVKNAVELHRGTITVKNKNGGGLEFIFSLHK
ncbi:sensor histidine kinase [Paludibacter jiangxiensis]|uniref:histidine kinase n=1 Tax=Paludibacter jiangxiensis TaxID=681398 RepID=A0A161LDR1_9BACT|nr:ATP-binding protein [Paludibacter jiangxiensis]GAT62435.1 His Kinase A (phospho-acceptor) domain-containing protein [Paludibacter jiangxiensis]